jgi:hypothetical protein
MFAATFKVLTAALVAAAVVFAPVHDARASVVFDWSYTAISYSPIFGNPVSASGTITATSVGGGVYDVTAITGQRNGVPITGLASYAEDDQKVYTAAADLYGFGAIVDVYGFAYEAGGADYNVYDILPLEGTDSIYYCGVFNYCEVGPSTSGYPLSFLTSGSVMPVPEPSAWTWALVGLSGLGLALRGRRAALLPAR